MSRLMNPSHSHMIFTHTAGTALLLTSFQPLLFDTLLQLSHFSIHLGVIQLTRFNMGGNEDGWISAEIHALQVPCVAQHDDDAVQLPVNTAQKSVSEG